MRAKVYQNEHGHQCVIGDRRDCPIFIDLERAKKWMEDQGLVFDVLTHSDSGMPSWWFKPVKTFANPPTKCSICNRELGLKGVFYDTRAVEPASWGYFCEVCNTFFGVTHGNDRLLGTGVGQKYIKQADGNWIKVAG